MSTTVDRKELADAIQQNGAIFSTDSDIKLTWVLMPCSLDLPPSPETLGSNWKEPANG